MNALVSFRTNASGSLTPSPLQRQEALEQVKALALARAVPASSTVSKAGVPSAAKTSLSVEDTTTETIENDMDRDAFLRLLVTQMQHQDPTNPMDNTEMIAQLAQFSSLEQMNNLNDTMNSLVGNVDQLNFISAQGLLGQYVEGVNAEGMVIQGEVDAVTLDGSIVLLSIDDQVVPMSGVLAIGTGTPAESAESGEN